MNAISFPATYQMADTKQAAHNIKMHMDGDKRRIGYLSYSFSLAERLQKGLGKGEEISALWEKCDNQTKKDLGITLDDENYQKMTSFLINTWAYGPKLATFRKEARRSRVAPDGTIRPYFPKKNRGFTAP